MIEIDTKERIKQQAHTLLMRYGIRSVSMDDIANGIGISKKTIYQFYADKDELVKAVVEDMINHSQGLCMHDVTTADNAVHELLLALRMIGEIFKGMNPSLLFDMQKYHPEAFQMFHKHKSEFLFSIICDNLARGIQEDLYRPDIKIELVARFRVESMMIPFSPEFQTHSKYTLTEMQQELLELYLFSLVNPRGYKMIAKYKQELEKKTTGHGATKIK